MIVNKSLHLADSLFIYIMGIIIVLTERIDVRTKLDKVSKAFSMVSWHFYYLILYWWVHRFTRNEEPAGSKETWTQKDSSHLTSSPTGQQWVSQL